VDGPRRHRLRGLRVVINHSQGKPSDDDYQDRVGYIQERLSGAWVDEHERPVLRRQLRRGQIEKFFAKLPPTRIGLEACGASHHWARVLRDLGHEVVLIPPQYIKPYVKRGKNDAIDAEVICEAMSRPGMRFCAGQEPRGAGGSGAAEGARSADQA
jgi:transposase